LDDTNKFKEMAFSMPRDQLQLLKSIANAGDESRAMVMCRLYYPNLTAVEAEKFMDWLRKEKA
jgi:hypothetical protein